MYACFACKIWGVWHLTLKFKNETLAWHMNQVSKACVPPWPQHLGRAGKHRQSPNHVFPFQESVLQLSVVACLIPRLCAALDTAAGAPIVHWEQIPKTSFFIVICKLLPKGPTSWASGWRSCLHVVPRFPSEFPEDTGTIHDAPNAVWPHCLWFPFWLFGTAALHCTPFSPHSDEWLRPDILDTTLRPGKYYGL